MIAIKSKGKPDADKVAVNGVVDKRPESSTSSKVQKEMAAAMDYSSKNGSFYKDDYRNNRTTGSYYKGNRVLLKNRSYSGEHGFTSRKHNEDVPKKRDDSFDSRSMYHSNYRGGK